MIDYKTIADGDPGGDLETAFAAMAAETVVQSRGAFKVTDIMIANALGLVAAEEFLADVEAVVSPRVASWLKNGGIDVNHADVIANLTAINPRHKDAVLALGNTTVPKYPGIKIGYLETARQLRTEGKI